jgi:hypothetical protein
LNSKFGFAYTGFTATISMRAVTNTAQVISEILLRMRSVLLLQKENFVCHLESSTVTDVLVGIDGESAFDASDGTMTENYVELSTCRTAIRSYR